MRTEKQTNRHRPTDANRKIHRHIEKNRQTDRQEETCSGKYMHG